MGRRIVTTQLQAAGSGQKPDDFMDRVVKYVPADIVAAWGVLSGLVAGLPKLPHTPVFWVLFVIVLILTPIWILRRASPDAPGKKPATLQAALSTVAFAVWVFALGEPFSSTWPEYWSQPLGAIVVGVITLILGAIVPPSNQTV